MKKTFIYSVLMMIGIFLWGNAQSQKNNTFPGKSWEVVSKPETLGLSAAALEEAKNYSKTINTAAVMVVVNGKVASQWGEVDKKYNIHSIRKSFMSALYGKYVKNGTIDLSKTMKDLGITDVGGLTDEELKATVRDCLKSRSGVYHDALYESPNMKALKPARSIVLAGTHWYYNNWDFNVLGTIFHQTTKKDFYQTLKAEITDPIGMEDFVTSDGEYFSGKESMHQAYPFRATARDLARFGLLFLNNGKWNGKQIIDASWVDESTRYHSDAALYSSDGYGYLWWVSRNYNKFPHLPNVDLPEGTYSARGAGGHYVLIIPKYNMVIVHRVDTDKRGNSVSKEEFGTLVQKILAARK